MVFLGKCDMLANDKFNYVMDEFILAFPNITKKLQVMMRYEYSLGIFLERNKKKEKS